MSKCKCLAALDSGRIPEKVCRFCWPAFWRGLRDGFAQGPIVRWMKRRITNARS